MVSCFGGCCDGSGERGARFLPQDEASAHGEEMVMPLKDGAATQAVETVKQVVEDVCAEEVPPKTTAPPEEAPKTAPPEEAPKTEPPEEAPAAAPPVEEVPEEVEEDEAPEDERHEEEDPEELREVPSLGTGGKPVLNTHVLYTITEEELAEVKKLLHSKQGWTVKKHCRDGRVRLRKMRLRDADKALTWNNGSKKIELDKVTEVRHGTALDPATVGQSDKRPKGMTGTDVLRRSADGHKVARRCFSLILLDRTFDLECADEDEAAKFCSAFQKLVENAHHAP